MRWIITILVSFIAAVAAPAFGQEVSFKLVRNMILMPVQVNGTEVLARLDTGGGVSLVGAATVARLKLPVAGTLKASGIGGKVIQYDTTAPLQLAFGGLTITTKPVVIVNVSSMAADADPPIGVTLGMDVVRDLVMEIDFDRSVIRFTPSVQFVAPVGREAVGIRRVGDDRTITAAVTNWTSVWAGFDTGHPGAIDLSDSVAKTALEGQSQSTFLAGGVDGLFVMSSATLPALTVAGVTLKDVPVSIKPQSKDRIGIGMDILKRFNLILDFSHDRMWMAPNGQIAQPFRKDRLGLWTYSNAWPRAALLVSPGSPAEKAGLKKGDVIAKIVDRLGKLVENTEYVLGGERVTVTLSDGSTRELIAADYF